MKKIYLIGIGGIAMANLACLLKNKGFLVSGSDLDTFGPSAILLRKHGIEYFKDHSEANIKKFKPDISVIGNAIQRGNPSLEYILNNRLPYCSMPEIIREELIKNKKSIVIAGTSGKTTTTAILAWILHKAGLKPTAFIGGIIKNTDSGFINGNGKYIVIEGDEYNSSFYDSCPKFIHYRPYHTIITNIQMDHLDIYGNIENIFQAFKKLVKLIPTSGSIVLNKDNKYTSALSQESKSKVVTFGKGGNLEAKNINYSPEGIDFEVIQNNKNLVKIHSHLLGNHNVENIISAIAIALNIKIPLSKISSALADFQGVKRRLEIIHQKGNITIIDDFAHNPDKVSASLSALKKHFPKHKIIAIFEPRTGSSRRKFFQDIYPASFALADTVYIGETYKKDALKKEEAFSSQQLAKDLNRNEVEAYALAGADKIISAIAKHNSQFVIRNSPILIVVMTSGEFDGIHQKLIRLFK